MKFKVHVMATKKLYRSQTDKMLTGLCGGIANYFSWDSTIVRVVAIILGFATVGLLIIGYFIVSLIVLKAPTSEVLEK